MRKKDSICSSDRPLVSGTQQPVNTRFAKQMAAKKKKGTWRPKAFWGCQREAGSHRGARGRSTQHECVGPAGLSQPWGSPAAPCPAQSPPRAPYCLHTTQPLSMVHTAWQSTQPPLVLGPLALCPSSKFRLFHTPPAGGGLPQPAWESAEHSSGTPPTPDGDFPPSPPRASARPVHAPPPSPLAPPNPLPDPLTAPG